MAEPERPLRTWAEIDESQKQQCFCDFSRLKAPLREYAVAHRVRDIDNPHKPAIHDVVMSRSVWGLSHHYTEDTIVFTCGSSSTVRRAIREAEDMIQAARKLYAARGA